MPVVMSVHVVLWENEWSIKTNNTYHRKILTKAVFFGQTYSKNRNIENSTTI